MWGHMAEEYAPGSFNLGYDEFSGTLTKMHITPDQKLIFENVTNIDAVAEQNREIRDSVSRTSKTGDMVKVASLDMQTYLDLMQRGILRERGAMKKWLASDEALPFRTHWMKS